jgi:hypothetical protein
MLLRPEQRTKLDETNDLDFYSYPRFVTHDEGASCAGEHLVQGRGGAGERRSREDWETIRTSQLKKLMTYDL